MFTPRSDSSLLKDCSSDLCAIALLHRWGLAHPRKADQVGTPIEKRFITKIQPLLSALRVNGGNHLQMKKIKITEMIHELGLGAKSEKTKKLAKVA